MWWGVWVYPVAVAVDGDMVVVPAEGCEVVRVVATAVGEPCDVVRFKPVAAGTAIYHTYSVSIRHCVPDSRRDRPCGR